MDNPIKGGFCGGVRWRQLSLDQVEVGRGSDGPNITQPKGLKCCAEIEAWQWVSPSGVGSWPAYSRASAGTGRNDTVACQAGTPSCPCPTSHHITFHHGIPMP